MYPTQVPYDQRIRAIMWSIEVDTNIVRLRTTDMIRLHRIWIATLKTEIFSLPPNKNACL